jgi:hemerythrin
VLALQQFAQWSTQTRRPTVQVIWDPSYETGHHDIDRQHQQLLALVDELESAQVTTHDSRALVLDVLGRVMDFTISHFAMEEALMAQVDYPQAPRDEMILQHRQFTADARLRVIEFRRSDYVSVLPLRAFLASWLTSHEIGQDALLADFIRNSMGTVQQPGAAG